MNKLDFKMKIKKLTPKIKIERLMLQLNLYININKYIFKK